MRKIMCAITYCLIAAVALAKAPAPNDKKSKTDSVVTALDLNELVVTGTRTPKALKDTPIQTRLITESELKKADATDIQDLLQQEIPGVEFSYAMNQQINMNLSGFSGQNVLVLLDGERLAGETMENTDFSRLHLNGIARIEIIRGAASALYGSNAAGGVVNIISKEADAPWRLNLNVRGSDHKEWRVGGSSILKYKKVSNVLDVNFNRIDTYNVCLNTRDECDFRSVYGYKNWNFRDRFTYKPLSNLALTARAGYFFKERYYNTDAPDRYRDFSGGLRGVWDIDAANHLELSYAFDQYDKSDFIKASKRDIRDYSNVQNSVRGLFSHSFKRGDVLSVGADFMRDYLLTYQFGPGETHKQLSADAFAQYDWNINKHWELVGAARWDYFSESKASHATGKLSARYNTGDLTLRGGYAGGFRAPTIKEMYMNYNMQDIFDIHGNKDLKAEKSHNFNISAEYSWKNFYFMLGGNYNFITNHITTSGIKYTKALTPYIEYVNVENMNVFGLDASVRARWSNGLSMSLSYNFTHEDNVSNSATQYCPARPHALNFKASWSREWIKNYATDITLSGRFLSKVSYTTMYMFEPFEERHIVNPAYTLWKIQLMQKVYEGITVTVAVDNLFNYGPRVYAFNAPITLGANLQLGVSIDVEKLVKK